MPTLPIPNNATALPQGTFNYGDPNLLCTKAKWTDILLFYSVNYLAHAVTVKSRPGERMADTAFAIFLALIYPYSGIARGLEAIVRHSNLLSGESELQKAARAGALCVVVRSKAWVPPDGRSFTRSEVTVIDKMKEVDNERGEVKQKSSPQDAIWGVEVPPEFTEGLYQPVLGGARNVHGIVHSLPAEYDIAVLPSNLRVEPSVPSDHEEIILSSSYSLVKSVVAIGQVLFASATLFRSRGVQLEKYGFAAFSLTIIPYIVMSGVNLLGNVLTPDYSTLYLVRSPEMREAENCGAHFEGVVGTVLPASWVEEEQRYIFEDIEDGMQVTPVPNSENRIYRIDRTPDNRPSRLARRKSKPKFVIRACRNFETTGTQVWDLAQATYAAYYFAAMLTVIPFAIIGGLTHFKKGSSTVIQQVFTLGWIVFGTIAGACIPLLFIAYKFIQVNFSRFRYLANLYVGVFLAMYSTFAIGGFVIVGLMLVDYGSCIRLKGV